DRGNLAGAQVSRAAALRAATAAPVLDTPNAETAGSPSDADGPPHRRHIAIGQVIVFLAVVAVVWYVERYRGATLLDAPADPTASDYPARPEWHTLFLYQWLKNFSGPSMEVVGAIVLPTLAGVVFLAFPWFDRVVHRHVARALTLLVTVGLLAGIGRLTATALRADADPSDAAVAASRERQAGGTGLTQRDEAVLRARRFNRQRGRAERVAARAMVLAERHGIPPEGPLTLLAADPAIQGPELFAGHCASCHRFDGHDGLGDLPSEAATSSDLYGYGTRGWIRGLLTDPMADRFFGRMKKPDGQAAHTRMSRLVADTLEENEDPADRRKLLADLDAVAAYLEDEGRRPGRLREILPPDDVDEEDDLDSDDEASDSVEPATEPPDGRTEDGALGSSSTVALSDAGDDEALILRGRHYFMSVCNECHSYDEERSGTLRAPEMLGYASVEWVELMIRNPSHDLRYRSRGREPAQMPSFADRLTGPQRLLIARWLVGSDEATVSVPAEGGLP
ncbi:MAG: hypothetical protein ACE5EX_11675, partial [Phycisphaerae bacterium]